MNRIEYGYCSACHRRHPRYQAVPDFPQPKRSGLKDVWRFVAGIALLYGFLVFCMAMAVR